MTVLHSPDDALTDETIETSILQLNQCKLIKNALSENTFNGFSC